MTALSALLVDDSPSARLFLKNMLEAHDVRVAVAESGASALNWLKAHRPDVVFLDHVMDGMDGIETMERLKQDPATADIPVVMCTSTDEEGFITEVRRLGALTVLSKPPVPARLSELLQEIGTFTPNVAVANAEPLRRGSASPPAVAQTAGRAEPDSQAFESVQHLSRGDGSGLSPIPPAEPAEVVGMPTLSRNELEELVGARLEERVAPMEAQLRERIQDDVDARVRILEARLRESLPTTTGGGENREALEYLNEQLKSMERKLQKSVKEQIADHMEGFESRVGRIVTNELTTNFAAFEAYLQSRTSEFDKAPVDQWRAQLFSDPGVKDVLRKAAAGAAETAVERMLVGIRGSDLERSLSMRLEQGLDSKETALRREMAESMKDINQRFAGVLVLVALVAVGVAAGVAFLF